MNVLQFFLYFHNADTIVRARLVRVTWWIKLIQPHNRSNSYGRAIMMAIHYLPISSFFFANPVQFSFTSGDGIDDKNSILFVRYATTVDRVSIIFTLCEFIFIAFIVRPRDVYVCIEFHI